MIDLTEWQINFVRKSIHFAKMMQNKQSCMDRDDIELIKFSDEFNKAYPCEGEDSE